MPVKVCVTMVMLLLLLASVLLQGCSSNSSNVESPSNAQSLSLTLESTSGATTLIADGDSVLQLQMTVATQDGNPVANTPVVFSTDAGTLEAIPGTNVVANPSALSITNQVSFTSRLTVTTDNNRVALMQLRSSTTVATATITAEVEGFRQTFTVSFISGVPAQLILAATPTTVGVGTTATVVATVNDSDNRPVSGTIVTFSLLTSNSFAATLGQTESVTDSNGQASVSYIAGTSQGTDTIQAQVNALTATVNVAVQAATSAAESIQLLVSSPQLDSDDGQPVALTALVRDGNNNFISDTEVVFSANSSGIQVTAGTTDESGQATALLSTAGDPANRTITLTATSGTLSSTNTVVVSGTTITINGTNTLSLGGQTTLSILLQDSGGNGIANETISIASNQGNTLSATTLTTDFNGQTTVTVTGDTSGVDTITASALSRKSAFTVTGTFDLSVSSADFSFVAPAADDREAFLGAFKTVTIRWLEAGMPQAGRTVNFFATRGTVTAMSVVTNANGEASTNVSSTTAGPAVITAEVDEPNSPSSQIELEFVATNPTSLILQADPTSLGVNLPGDNDQQSIVTAVVRDPEHNLVKNQQVSFTLTDNTGGSIFPSSAITDSFGRASTVYTAGSSSSAQDGVHIEAEVVGTTGCNPADPVPAGPCDKITLTVSQQSLFVTLGTSHLIDTPSNTQYAKPYTVLVTDANSNPIEGANVELNIYAVRYQKGFYTPVDTVGGCTWSKFVNATCQNEDINRNGILDAGEDFNANTVLDPGNVAAVPVTVTTDASGFALFDIVYAREFVWAIVQVEARATVAGSEDMNTATFTLPGLAADFNDCQVAPPGVLSPFGTARTCSCDEETDPTCLTLSFLAPLVVVPNFVALPPGGGSQLFTVAGGTESIYLVSTTGGLLNVQQISFDPVAGHATFTLTTSDANNDSQFEVTVEDAVTGNSVRVPVHQAP